MYYLTLFNIFYYYSLLFFSLCIYSWNRLSSFLIPLFLFVNHLLRNSSAFIEGSLTTWVQGNFEVFWLFSLQVEDNSRNSRQITLIFSKIPCFLEIIFMRLGNNYFLKSCPQLFILNSCPQLFIFGNSCSQLYLISLGTTIFFRFWVVPKLTLRFINGFR